MMDRTKQLIEELISHLDMAQGDDLMGLINKSKAPAPGMDEAGQPKGISIAKIDVEKPEGNFDDKVNSAIGEAPKAEGLESPSQEAGEGEMTDQELSDLLKEYLKK